MADDADFDPAILAEEGARKSDGNGAPLEVSYARFS